MRLTDIPENKLEQIQKFIKDNLKKYPVTSAPGGNEKVKTLPELIKEYFDVDLSPPQVYQLAKGYKTVKVKLNVETIRTLEEEYGSVEKGLASLAKEAQGISVSAYLRPAIKKLAAMGSINYTTIIKTLADLGYSDPDQTLKQIFKSGFATQNHGIYKFNTTPEPPWFLNLTL